MQLKRWLSPIMVLVLLLAGMVGCGTSAVRSIDLVPQNANFIADVQLGKIINDQEFRNAYAAEKKSPQKPQTVDAALDKVVQETGVDLRNISRGVVFGDVNNLGRDYYLGVIVEGTFNQATFISNFETKAKEKFTVSDYKGYKLYTSQDGQSNLAFLSDGMLLFGSTKAVKDIIDVSKGDSTRVSGQVLNMYNQMDGTLFRAAFIVPESGRKELSQAPVSGVPFSFKPFADTDLIGFAMSKDAQLATLQVNLHFISSTSAGDARDTLSGAFTSLKGMSLSSDVKDLLGKIVVTTSGSTLTLTLKATLSQIEKVRQ